MRFESLRVMAWTAVLAGFLSSPAMRSEEAKPQPEWPKVVSVAGANESADLIEWQPENLADYSGHYVSASVTDGWVDWRVKVHRDGADEKRPWVVDVYQHDDRLDPDQRDADFAKLPLHPGPHAWFQLKDGGTTYFFARYSRDDPKRKPWSKPVIVSESGSLYVYEPVPPPFIILDGRETPLKYEPWIPKDLKSYTGIYVCQSLAKGKGTREVELEIKRDDKQPRLPWRVDMSNTEEGTDTKYPDYEYTNRPLWTETWPHFDAYGTFLLVRFTDPRKPEPKPEDALINERGEVFVRKVEEGKK
jgi:hypothetical protein